jgi:subtilisin-like proprotein convertase family protein
MNQDGDTINGELTQDIYSASYNLTSNSMFNFYNTTVASIRDLSRTVSYISITQDLKISDLNVVVDLTHTYDSDLIISLKSPAGVVSTLSYRRGGSGDNFLSTIFDDEATKTISSGLAPFKGTFKPDTTLSVFDGSNARGIWTLTVEDKARGDIGKLNKWGLSISGSTTLTATNNVRKFDGEIPVAETPAEPITAPSQEMDCPRSGIETPAPSENLKAPSNNLTNESVAQRFLDSNSQESSTNNSNRSTADSVENSDGSIGYSSDSVNLSDYFFSANNSTVSFYGVERLESEVEEDDAEINIHDAVFIL